MGQNGQNNRPIAVPELTDAIRQMIKQLIKNEKSKLHLPLLFLFHKAFFMNLTSFSV